VTAPECIRPRRRTYGALLGLWLDECSHDWMFARFLSGGDVETWEVPESELFSTLTKLLAAGARSRLAGAEDRKLAIWKDDDGWHVESV
jgi:hypothetical protein